MPPAQIRALFLAANPRSQETLDLDGEYNQIEDQLYAGRHAKSFLLHQRWKVSRDHLLDLLLKYRPHIVHFSGHGAADQLLLQDAEGNAWPLERNLAREVFRAARDTLKLVVLNACYSRDVAEEISENIECVIGMAASVHDATALRFSGALYRALGQGTSVREAFDQARTQINLSELPGKYVPQILSMPGVDPRELYPLRWLQEGVPSGAKGPPPVGITLDMSALQDRPSIRRALLKYLPSDEQFTEFVSDYFRDVAMRFGGGMDRLARTNLLLTIREPAEIAGALQRYLEG